MRRLQSVIVALVTFGMLLPTATFAQTKAAKTVAAATKEGSLPPLSITEFKLKNGLRVIFHEDHSTPIVGVNLWYHVGSKNEVPARPVTRISLNT